MPPLLDADDTSTVMPDNAANPSRKNNEGKTGDNVAAATGSAKQRANPKCRCWQAETDDIIELREQLVSKARASCQQKPDKVNVRGFKVCSSDGKLYMCGWWGPDPATWKMGPAKLSDGTVLTQNDWKTTSKHEYDRFSETHSNAQVEVVVEDPVVAEETRKGIKRSREQDDIELASLLECVFTEDVTQAFSAACDHVMERLDELNARQLPLPESTRKILGDQLLKLQARLAELAPSRGAQADDRHDRLDEICISIEELLASFSTTLPTVSPTLSPPLDRDLDWQIGMVAIGVQRGKGDPVLMGSGWVVDAPLGLICTCAHVVIDCFNISDVECMSELHIAIGVGIDEPIRWCQHEDNDQVRRHAEVRYLSLQPSDGRPSSETISSSHLVRDNKRLDLAVLQLQYSDGVQTWHDPRRAPHHWHHSGQLHGDSPIALPLGRSSGLTSGFGGGLTLLGYGQAGGFSKLGQEKTSTIVTGRYAGRWESGDGKWLKANMSIYDGHSGGPVLNRRGEVIGWAVRSTTRDVNGQLRPIEELEDAVGRTLDELGRPTAGDVRERLQGAEIEHAIGRDGAHVAAALLTLVPVLLWLPDVRQHGFPGQSPLSVGGSEQQKSPFGAWP